MKDNYLKVPDQVEGRYVFRSYLMSARQTKYRGTQISKTASNDETGRTGEKINYLALGSMAHLYYFEYSTYPVPLELQ